MWKPRGKEQSTEGLSCSFSSSTTTEPCYMPLTNHEYWSKNRRNEQHFSQYQMHRYLRHVEKSQRQSSQCGEQSYVLMTSCSHTAGHPRASAGPAVHKESHPIGRSACQVWAMRWSVQFSPTCSPTFWLPSLSLIQNNAPLSNANNRAPSTGSFQLHSSESFCSLNFFLLCESKWITGISWAEIHAVN